MGNQCRLPELMSKKVRCSVAMATYNGELYIAEQIESVLKNIGENDELIISDDGSSDKTREIIETYMKNDSRIQLIEGPRKGVVSNFENALKHTAGEVVFLCDQDDIWADNKVQKVLNAMDNDVTVVLHDAEVFQEEEVICPSFMQHRGSGKGVFHNLVKNSYIGCCMAIRRELLEYVLPFPKKICMHDQWIGLVSELYGESRFIEDRLLRYRRHGNNTSSMTGQKTSKKIQDRVFMIMSLLQLRFKRRR